MQSKILNKKNSWKEIGENVFINHFTSAEDGQEIYLKHISSGNTNNESGLKPIVLFLFHDITSYHGRFVNLIEWFKQHHKNVSFVLMDFVGHGLSSGTRGHVADLRNLIIDAANVFEMLDKKEDETWIALGHGLGALILLNLINQFDETLKAKIDKLIFSNFSLKFQSSILQLQNQVLESLSLLSDFMSNTRLTQIYRAEELLSSTIDQAVYLEDPLIVKNPTYLTLNNINQKMRSIYQEAYFIDRPVLILQSSSPYLVNGGMDLFAKGVKKTLLMEKKYFNLKHDLYNESDRLMVFNDIAKWVLNE